MKRVFLWALFLCVGVVSVCLFLWKNKRNEVLLPQVAKEISLVPQAPQQGDSQEIRGEQTRGGPESNGTRGKQLAERSSFLDPPQNLRAENDNGSIVLEWDACTQSDEYHIFRGKTQNELREIAVVKSTIPFYLDTEIEKNVRYYYGVRIKDGDRLSNMSNIQVCSILLPVSPVGLRRPAQTGEREVLR